MFIPAATALKNLVYRVIPTPGQAFHGSVTLTTFFSIFLISSSLLFFSPRPAELRTETSTLWNRFRFLISCERKPKGVRSDNRRQGTWSLEVSRAGTIVAVMMFPNQMQHQIPISCTCHNNEMLGAHSTQGATCCCPALLCSLTLDTAFGGSRQQPY